MTERSNEPDPNEGVPRRRKTDQEDFVAHMQAADSGLQMGRRWIEIIILLIGFGVMIGTTLTKFSAQEKAFDDFKQEMRIGVKDANSSAQTASNAVRDLSLRLEAVQKQSDEDHTDLKELQKLTAVMLK